MDAVDFVKHKCFKWKRYSSRARSVFYGCSRCCL